MLLSHILGSSSTALHIALHDFDDILAGFALLSIVAGSLPVSI
jgi:hypothetical protein